ncbi:MAG: VCBS repeat-containing protein [Candidatus Magasanikbacteria bacterium]|nr:VCBS repeat-containing protein [Candidatus Magasanikbacteria bacterium]
MSIKLKIYSSKVKIVFLATFFVFGFLFAKSEAKADVCPLASGQAYKTPLTAGVYYITEQCTKQPIKNPQIFFSHFTSWSEVRITSVSVLNQVPDDSLGFMPWGSLRKFENGSLIKTVTDPRVFLLINSMVFPVDSEQVFSDLGMAWNWVEDVTPTVMNKYSVGPIITGPTNYPNGLAFKYSDSPKVYIIYPQPLFGNRAKYYINSMSDLNVLYRADHIPVLQKSVTFPDLLPEITPTTPNQSSSQPALGIPVGQNVIVNSVSTLRQALLTASAGTTIILKPGTYDLSGVRLTTTRGGTASQPITLKAESRNTAILVTNQAEEAFYLTVPYYVFDGLSVQIIGTGSYHAYKLNDDAHDIVIKNGKMEVFKGGESAIKGASPGTVGPYPDNLLVENNEIFFHEPTDYVVAEGIDGIGVKGWVIRGNNIHDIKIANKNSHAWGIVLKGNSQDSLIENNTFDNNDIAISIGGTSATQYFRNGERTYEHNRAIVRGNTIRHTRGVAIYIERGHDTQISGNLVTDSSMNGDVASIDVRYRESTATLQNNTLDKIVRDRDGGTHSGVTDLSTPPIETPVTPPAANPNPNQPTAPVSVSGLSLIAEDSGLPGMYGGAWGKADFDGDGFLDLVVYGHYRTMFHSSDNPSGGSDELRLYKNVSTRGGAIRFQLQQVVVDNNGNRGAMVVVGDFNGDHRPDFAVQTRNGGRGAGFINDGNWHFTRREFEFTNDSTTFAMAVADVNRDSKDDIIFAADGGVTAGLWYEYNISTNTWTPHQRDFVHRMTYGSTIAAGDFTGDGYPDFVVGGNASTPFGTHDCSRGARITSGEILMYGQANRNLGGNAGFDTNPLAIVSAFGYKVSETTKHDLSSCHGMDNAQMFISDVDLDGKNDIIIAGSSTGQNGQVGRDGQQYDFAVLFNDGTGANFAIWENTGVQDAQGRGFTNGGVGNLDFPSIAVGDLNGDNLPDVFIEGHRRDFTVANNPYVYENMLFLNNGNRSFSSVPLTSFLPTFEALYTLPSGLGFLSGRTRYVAEGGSLITDFNLDGKLDLLFSGAELPYHTNGVNFRDYNTAESLKTYVFRNTK